MTWEYSGDPTTSAKDEVRFMLGDVNEDDPQLEDEEIDYLLTKHGDVGAAAIAGCTALATRYGQRAVDTKVVGDLRIEYADRAANFTALAQQIASTVSTVRPKPVAMGITHSQKREAEEDTDRVRPSIRIGMDDHPGLYPDDDPIRSGTP